ncbi:MAG: hypothetical protein QW035_02730 [Candidatus Anstonellales archaeon]
MLRFPTKEEQKELARKVKEYYASLYPSEEISIEEEVFTPEEIGEMEYLYSGEQVMESIAGKIEDLKELAKKGITPHMVLISQKRKGKEARMVLDGHLRSIFAYSYGIAWPAFLVVLPPKARSGISYLKLGKVKEVVQLFNQRI